MSRNMEMRSAIATLESAIGNPQEGLPSEVFLFVSRLTPLANVDLLIKDDRGRTLLTWRQDEFFGAGWHVPGGIIRFKETFADRIRACARQELGAAVSSEAAPIKVIEGIAAQSTRGHAISLLFRCRLLGPPDQARRAESEHPSPGQWRWHQGAPPNLIPAQRQYVEFL
jgi:ADP-ribose pyrophosphatase YjhB (NUDIX family)